MVFEILGAVVIIGVGGVLVAASQKPDEFRFSRSTVIKAPPSAIFPHINNIHKWQTWSPWAEMEPNAKTSFSGPDDGVGASMRWDGKKTGSGVMTVKESIPDQAVRLRLEFFKPMKGVNTAEFELVPDGQNTRVTWNMYGPSPFISKVMSVVMNCEKMMATQFDKGLSNLKAIAEKS